MLHHINIQEGWKNCPYPLATEWKGTHHYIYYYFWNIKPLLSQCIGLNMETGSTVLGVWFWSSSYYCLLCTRESVVGVLFIVVVVVATTLFLSMIMIMIWFVIVYSHVFSHDCRCYRLARLWNLRARSLMSSSSRCLRLFWSWRWTATSRPVFVSSTSEEPRYAHG